MTALYNFPTLSPAAVPDSSQFQVMFEDPVMRSEMEGGYVITRARHTRAPRKTWRIVYRMLRNFDRLTLESFWTTVRGGSATFNWTNPQDGSTYIVRFKDPLQMTYVGRGSNQRWDCSFTLEQA